MSYVPYKSGTLLVPSGNKNHLFVIVTDACSKGQYLLVNFSTIHPGAYYDDTCLVDPGEHPFIKSASYVFYSHARVEAGARLAKLVETLYWRECEPVNDNLLKRIYDGFLRSPHVKNWVKNYLRAK